MGTPAVLECFGRSRGPQRSYRLVRPFQRIRCHPETPLRPCLCMYTPQHVFWLMWWFLESNNFINLQFFSKKPIWVINRTLCYIHRLFGTFKWTRVKFFLNKDCSYKFIIKKTLYCLSNLSFSVIMPFPEWCTVFCLWSLVFPQLLNNVFFVSSQSLAWTVTRNQSGWIVTQLLAMTVHQWWAVSWNPALLSTVRRMRVQAGQTLLNVSFPWNTYM